MSAEPPLSYCYCDNFQVPPHHLTPPGLKMDDFSFLERTLFMGSLKVSGYAKGSAGWVLTAGVIEQHDVVQGDVALPLLGNFSLKDDLRRRSTDESSREGGAARFREPASVSFTGEALSTVYRCH